VAIIKVDYWTTIAGLSNQFLSCLAGHFLEDWVPWKGWAAQTFTASKQYVITSVKIPLYRYSPTNYGYTLVVSIKAVDGSDRPTGADLCSATMNTNDIAAGENWTEFDFGAGTELTEGVSYAIVGRVLAAEYCTAEWVGYGADGYEGGGLHWSATNGASWDTEGDYTQFELCFETWGEVAEPAKAKNPTPTNTNTDVKLSLQTVTWEDGGGADTYNVYYGTTSGALTLVSSAQAGTSYTVWDTTDGSPYDYLDVRYWRIDSTNDAGTTTGDEWVFTAMSITYPNPNPEDPDPDNPYPPDHTFDPNFIRTTQRLTCVGTDADGNGNFWYEVG